MQQKTSVQSSAEVELRLPHPERWEIVVTRVRAQYFQIDRHVESVWSMVYVALLTEQCLLVAVVLAVVVACMWYAT